MEKYAITISRQFASMGRSIAQELAEQLHIEFLDRDIVDETAKRMNATVRQIRRRRCWKFWIRHRTIRLTTIILCKRKFGTRLQKKSRSKFL